MRAPFLSWLRIDKSGFGLIEQLVALVVAGIAMLALASLLTASHRLRVRSDLGAGAFALVESSLWPSTTCDSGSGNNAGPGFVLEWLSNPSATAVTLTLGPSPGFGTSVFRTSVNRLCAP